VTILADLEGSVEILADGSVDLLGDVEIDDTDTFYFDLTVDARAAVAFAQRFQQLGVGITINGVVIPDREIGNLLTITESADSYGDRLTFQLLGEKWSPFARNILRSKALVEVNFVIGNTANEFRKKVFTGYVISHTYDAIGSNGPSATVECMDAAGLYAERRAKTWTLGSNSGRDRLSIGLELAAIGEIPTAHIDLGGNGGTVRKPLAPGNQPILDYLRDIWGILGAEIGFEGGLLCARRYDPNVGPPVIELHAGNLLVPASITTPDTLSANVTGVVSVAFSQEEIGGLRTVEERVVTVGPYSPVSAEGVWPTLPRTISEIVTLTTYLGTLAVRTDRKEWGWYAPRAASGKFQEIVDPPGYEIVEPDDPYWIFPDGSARSVPVERYQLSRWDVTEKGVDGDYNVVSARESKHFFHFLRKGIWQVDISGDVVPYDDPTPITDDGQGVQSAYERMGPYQAYYTRPDELTETEYELNPDGTIATETETHHFYDIGSPLRQSISAYGFGVDSIVWASRNRESQDGDPDPWGGLRTTTRRYRVIDEDRYEVTERVTSSTEAPRTTTRTMTGAPPRPERAEPESTSQEIRAIVEDRERIFLAGEEIESIESNEFVETSEEAAAYALILARRAAARTLTCAIPIETLVHKFRMVRVNLPGASINGLKFYVREVERNAADFTETITADYYPSELG